MRLKKIISLMFFVIIEFSFAQFNTLTYTIPQKENFPKKDAVEVNAEKQKKETIEKKRKWTLFGGDRNVDLKKEIDSIKLLIKSQRTVSQNINYNNEKTGVSVKKFDFIKEPEDLIINKISMPLKNMEITSPFGVRIHPIFGGRKMHTGIDLRANYENVYAVLNGIVSAVGWDNKGGGYFIKIRHSDRFETSYLHLSEIYYKLGDNIKAGFIIAKSGNTGNSTAPHLHFAVKEYGNFINPTDFLNDIIKINNLIALQYEHRELTN